MQSLIGENMKEYLLLLPIIFIFHDMEEVVGLVNFFRKNEYLFERFPFLAKTYKGLSSRAFAAGVYEEFIPFFGISLLAYYFPCKILYALWFGAFLGLSAHFIIHLIFWIILRKYIPSVITSIICLPASLIILQKCAAFMVFDISTISCIVISIITLMINLKLLHKLARFIDKKSCLLQKNGN